MPPSSVRISSTLWTLLLVGSAGCTTLGPMPTTTGVSAIPVHRPGVEVSIGWQPSYYLSDTVVDDHSETAPVGQATVIIEPDRLIEGAARRGVILGARSYGEDGDAQLEPIVGVRRSVGERVAIGGIGFGTYARGANQGASYEALRLGAELIVDLAVIPGLLHGFGGVSATYINADGRYCTRPDGTGRDCGGDPTNATAEIDGIYSAGTAGLALDIARRATGTLHSIRLAAAWSVGVKPRVRDGLQERSGDLFRSFGLSLTVGLGSRN